MDHYWNIIVQSYTGYAGYLWHEITHPSWHNYVYWLLGLLAMFFAAEWARPWRERQKRLRRDFFLDLFYVFFNAFLFSLIIHNAASNVVVDAVNEGIWALFGVDLQRVNPLAQAPLWCVLLVGFVVRDFVQWWIHRLLHASPFLWQFHKVHHSVQEMGFAAYMRYHWMENIVYRSLEYMPLALLGIGLYDFFIIHIFTLAVGYYNHSNLSIPSRYTGAALGLLLGLGAATALDLPGAAGIVLAMLGGGLSGWFVLSRGMKLVFNYPQMHIWHHALNLPEGRQLGVNFGLTLAIWDHLFKTAYVPHDGRGIPLGFPGVETFPQSFLEQARYGLGWRKHPPAKGAPTSPPSPARRPVVPGADRAR